MIQERYDERTNETKSKYKTSIFNGPSPGHHPDIVVRNAKARLLIGLQLAALFAVLNNVTIPSADQ
jgi:hypothetical protein